jgi:hypothetical protein
LTTSFQSSLNDVLNCKRVSLNERGGVGEWKATRKEKKITSPFMHKQLS